MTPATGLVQQLHPGADFNSARGAAFSCADGLLSFDAAMGWEDAQLKRATAGQLGAACLIWSMAKGLVVPRGFSQQPAFARAVEEMRRVGWPVHLRQTGGDLTPQAPGVINVSYIFTRPWTETLSITATYKSICQPIVDLVAAEFDLEGYCSDVAGAFCDGKFNVVVGGVKIAGTAQRWRQFKNEQGEPQVAVLGHAALLGDVDTLPLIQAANRFYQLCEIERQIEPDNQASLSCLVSGRFDQVAVMHRLLEGYEQASVTAGDE